MLTYEWMNWLMIDVCIKIMRECMFVKNFVNVKFVVDVKKNWMSVRVLWWM